MILPPLVFPAYPYLNFKVKLQKNVLTLASGTVSLIQVVLAMGSGPQLPEMLHTRVKVLIGSPSSCQFHKTCFQSLHSGLYHKHMTIVNVDSSVISEQSF